MGFIKGSKVVRIPLTTVKEQERESIGGFTETRKMPWISWSTPAVRCQVGSRLRDVPGSTCSGCYARKGNYMYPNVQSSLERRFQALENLAQWQADMIIALLERAARWEGEGRPAFRWHDSGDIQSAAHLASICAVARATPGIDHWLPTREFGYVAEYFSAGGKRPKNLTIRLSAHMIDGTAPLALARKYRLAVSTVHTAENNYPAAAICPAYRQGGECGECRNCWNNKVAHVSYPKH